VKGQLVVVDLYPSLLQPEGDRGNAVVLAHRARCFGVEATATVVHPGDPLPAADIVCLGGSEDADLAVAADRLGSSDLAGRVADGAVVFGVGAGYALLGRGLVAPDGARHQGLGLLDVTMNDSGDLVSGPVLTLPATELGLGSVSGYEYHRQVATRGPDAEPWLPLEVGRGDDGFAGSRRQSVVGCWMHGPVLPRNPDLADLLLRWAGVAVDPAGCPEDAIAADVRTRRAAEARTAAR
jgi:lipid II isoglutaminyl synthase (glutamine-hydrolysing)